MVRAGASPKPKLLPLMINAVATWLRGAPEGRIYKYEPTLDSVRSHLTKQLTFQKLDIILRNGDDGDITEALELFEELEARDCRMMALAETRRSALTGLEWQIKSGAKDEATAGEKEAGEEAARYVRGRLAELADFEEALEHLATAIGPNLAVLELIWRYGELVGFTPIPNWRLTMKPEKSLDIRVLTDEERADGIVASTPKFVVHKPRPCIGSPTRKAISSSSAWLCLFKKLARADWGTFCEIFGMPVRVGTYNRGAQDDEKKALKTALESLGASAWALKSESTQIDFVESSQRGTSPHQAFINDCNLELGVLWLGGNLTADTTGGTGTYSAAVVQEGVRDDRLDADIRAEARTVRRQIIQPMIEYAYRGQGMPVPKFERLKPKDSKAEAERIAAVQKTGAKIGEDYAYEALDIPKPAAGERTLEPPDAFEEGLAEGMTAEG